MMRFLIFGALLPPLILMYQIYRYDKVEKEPVGLVFKTFLFGAISVIPVLILELILAYVIDLFVNPMSLIGLFVDNFIGVALVEEFFKMQACKLSVWKNPEFNYTFDGIVYAVASAIGFAALENISYVISYGNLSTVIMRALTAIPAHTIFGIFMGMHMGMAKYQIYRNNTMAAKRELKMALLIPTLLHGSYDFICSLDNVGMGILFFLFIVILDVIAIGKVKKIEKEDQEIF